MPAEGFKGHVATGGSLLGMAGKWRSCGWSVVQLDFDEELGPLYGMYGSMEAEFEVQRTIKRAELTAFRRGERKCIDPKAGDADLLLHVTYFQHLASHRHDDFFQPFVSGSFRAQNSICMVAEQIRRCFFW